MENPTPHQAEERAVHALATGQQLSGIDIGISCLTDLLFRRFSWYLAGGPDQASVSNELDGLAARLLLDDLNAGDLVDSADALSFRPTTDGGAVLDLASLCPATETPFSLGVAMTQTMATLAGPKINGASFSFSPLALSADLDHVVAALGAQGAEVMSLAQPSRPTLYPRVSLAGQASSVAVRGHFAYVGTDTGTLHRLDLSTLAGEATVSVAELPAPVVEVSAADSGVYVLDATNTVLRVNVDAENPIEATWSVPTHAQGLTASGSVISFSTAAGLTALETDGEALELLGALPLDSGSEVSFTAQAASRGARVAMLRQVWSDISGNRVNWRWRLHSVEVDGEPRLVSSIGNASSPAPSSVSLSEDAAYVAFDSDVMAFDLDTLRRSRLFRAAGPSSATAVVGDTVVSVTNRVAELFDARGDPGLTALPLPGDAVRVAVSGDLASVASGAGGLTMLQISGGALGELNHLVGSYFAFNTTESTESYDAALLDGRVYVVERSSSVAFPFSALRRYDLPLSSGSADAFRLVDVTSVAVLDTTTLVVGGPSLHAVDPDSLVSMGSLDLETPVQRLATEDGRYVYALSDGDVRVFDFLDVPVPVDLGSVGFEGDAHQISLNDAELVVVGPRRATVLGLGAPGEPAVTDDVVWPDGERLLTAGTATERLLLLADSHGWLWALDRGSQELAAALHVGAPVRDLRIVQDQLLAVGDGGAVLLALPE